MAGWGATLAGERLDDRRGDRVVRAESPEEAIAQARTLLSFLRPLAPRTPTDPMCAPYPCLVLA